MALVLDRRLALPLWVMAFFILALTAPPTLALLPILIFGIALMASIMTGPVPPWRTCPSRRSAIPGHRFPPIGGRGRDARHPPPSARSTASRRARLTATRAPSRSTTSVFRLACRSVPHTSPRLTIADRCTRRKRPGSSSRSS